MTTLHHLPEFMLWSRLLDAIRILPQYHCNLHGTAKCRFGNNGIETILPLKKLARAQIPSDGSVDLIFPNRSAISGEVTFDIRSPDGELLTRKEVASLPEDVVLARSQLCGLCKDSPKAGPFVCQTEAVPRSRH